MFIFLNSTSVPGTLSRVTLKIMTTETPSREGHIRKSKKTREQILNTALALFATKGYQATTLRDIAAEAGCSLGLTYRYFARKEDLVLGLYERLAGELEEEVRALSPAPLAQRFEQAMRADLRRVAPYRAAFGALFGIALLPESEVAVLGDKVANVRARVWRVFLSVAEGATDAPRSAQARDLATVLYAIHLLLLLFWLQDRSLAQRATGELLSFVGELAARFRPFLRLPFVAKSLARVATILGPLFGPTVAKAPREEVQPAAPGKDES